ncbi:MAG TPA: radical SAM protein, partial [Spirochaetota bacterium]|nr:radical SAM protein [Spirochaetota bacterium]
MAKCILISYAGYPYTLSSLLLDNGLANLAGALLANGHQVKILDLATVTTIKKLFPPDYSREITALFQQYGNAIYEKGINKLIRFNKKLQTYQQKRVREIGRETAAFIKKEGADFAGIKLWNGDGFSGSIAIAEEIKKALPGLPLAAGGPHVDMFREYILEETDVFDILAYGDGEEVVVKLAEYFDGRQELDAIPNVIYRKNGNIKIAPVKWITDLDSLPFPVYDEDIYLAMQGDEKIKTVVLDESRGCPNCCYFCMQPIKSGTRLRKKTAERLVSDIKKIKKLYHINCFRFAGSGTPAALIRDTAGKLIEQNINIKYTMFARIKDSRGPLFELLARSGCRAIFFGVESGSQQILDKSLGKKLKVEKVKEIIPQCKQAGIFVITSFIFPAPFDTPATMRESLDLIYAIRPDSVSVIPGGIPRGTVWDKQAAKFGFDFENGKKDYFKALSKYKYKLFLPLNLWESLPIKINGESFHEFIKKSDLFKREVEDKEILTSMPDELVPVAEYAGYKGNEKEFRNLCRR